MSITKSKIQLKDCIASINKSNVKMYKTWHNELSNNPELNKLHKFAKRIMDQYKADSSTHNFTEAYNAYAKYLKAEMEKVKLLRDKSLNAPKTQDANLDKCYYITIETQLEIVTEKYGGFSHAKMLLMDIRNTVKNLIGVLNNRITRKKNVAAETDVPDVIKQISDNLLAKKKALTDFNVHCANMLTQYTQLLHSLKTTKNKLATVIKTRAVADDASNETTIEDDDSYDESVSVKSRSKSAKKTPTPVPVPSKSKSHTRKNNATLQVSAAKQSPKRQKQMSNTWRRFLKYIPFANKTRKYAPEIHIYK